MPSRREGAHYRRTGMGQRCASGSNAGRQRTNQPASPVGGRAVCGRSRPLGLRPMAHQAGGEHSMGLVAKPRIPEPPGRVGSDHRRLQGDMAARSADSEGLAGRERRLDLARFQRLAHATRQRNGHPAPYPVDLPIRAVGSRRGQARPSSTECRIGTTLRVAKISDAKPSSNRMSTVCEQAARRLSGGPF